MGKTVSGDVVDSMEETVFSGGDVSEAAVSETVLPEIVVSETVVGEEVDSASETSGGGDCAKTFKKCLVCEKKCNRRIKRCKECKSGVYCSRACRDLHKQDHQELCGHIQELEKIEKSKLVADAFTVREENQVPLRIRNELVRLVGEKPLLSCSLEGKKCKGLWDTGSMVCMINSGWLRDTVPEARIMSIKEFLAGDNLHLVAANNTDVNIGGVVVLRLRVGSYEIPVPFLVTNDELCNPIIGYNVIKHVVQSGAEDLPQALRDTIPSLGVNADAVISLLQSDTWCEEDVKVARDTTIPPHSRYRVACRTRLVSEEPNQNVIFSPYPWDMELEMSESVVCLKRGKRTVQVVVTNPTNSPLVLKKGLVLGSLESVSAVVPVGSADDSDLVNRVSVNNVEVLGSEDSVANVDFDLSHLPEDQRVVALQLLNEEMDVFCVGKEDHGDCPDFVMDLNLVDNVPVVVPHRQIPRPLYEEVKNFLNDLIANNWVRESKSSYSSPIVCVRKKDGGLRLCIDYRQLNKKIVPDKQPIPRIQELFDGLGGQEYFSTLDMAKAYHQGYVGEEFRHYTAFSTPWGLYEWIRVPMGISNAPPAFQRFINQTLANLRDKVCAAYLDDILIYARTFDEHIHNLRLVLQRLKSRGIKLRADKCRFFQKEVRYLGRLVSKDGHRPDPKDTVVLEKFRTPPKTIGELRTLLGFLGYYRSYIPDFSRKFQQIYQLLKSDPHASAAANKQRQQKNSRTVLEWTVAHQEVVNAAVDFLQSPSFLAFPDFSLPFVLNCDASERGLGAVLYQKQNGKDRVISFGSRSLTDAERRYHLHSGKLEFLCLKWAVTEKFADYLCFGPGFTVYTDNNPLTYVMSSAKLNATGLRWVADLSNYQFDIRYKPGRKHGDADGLSRWPMSLEEMEAHCTKSTNLEDLCDQLTVCAKSEPTPCSIADVNMLRLPGDIDATPISREELCLEQSADEVIGPVYKCVAENRRPLKEEWATWTRRSRVMFHQFKKLSLENGLLVRKTKNRRQLVLPTKFHDLVFQELHSKMGHLGHEKVEELSRQRFYWPFMQQDIEFFIRHKCVCLARKQPVLPERAPLVPITTSAPFEMICVDYCELDVRGGYRYVLMVTDHFSKFTQAYGTKNKDGISAAAKLFNDFFPKFGFPDKIHHDLGREFNNALFGELHRLSGVDISCTTPYHPQGNGACERMNKTLIGMLRSLADVQKNKWREQLPHLMFAYNSTIHKSTSFSPFYLLFGRESRLPLDCILPLEPEKTTTKTYDQFVKNWKASMRDAFQVAGHHMQQAGGGNKRRYDAKARSALISTGDHVLVRNTAKGGTGKLRSWWEDKIYVVHETYDHVPVFVVVPLDGGKSRTLHRNMLMKVDYLPLDTFGQNPNLDEASLPAAVPKRRARRPRSSVTLDADSESDSESDDLYVPVANESLDRASLPSPALVSDSGSDTDVELRRFEETHDEEHDVLRLPGHVQSGTSPSRETTVLNDSPWEVDSLPDSVNEQSPALLSGQPSTLRQAVSPVPSVGQPSSDTAVAASGGRLLSGSGDMHSPTHSKLLSSSSDLRSVPSDTTLVGDESPASLHTNLPAGPVSVVEGGGDVSVSSPDVTFMGFPSSDEEDNQEAPVQPDPPVTRSSESSEYLSAVEGPSAGGQDLSDQSAVTYLSADSDVRNDEPECSGGTPTRDSSDLSSSSPPERPRFPSRLQRYPQRVRQRRTVLVYESLGEPHVSEYKIPKLPRHLR